MPMPNIPAIPTSVDARVRQALESLRFYFKAVDQQGGVVTLDQITTGQVAIPSDSVQPSSKPIYFKPENLIAISAIGAVMLRWKSTTLGGISYTEVLRAETDDATSAVVVAQVNGFSYTDYPSTDPAGKDFFYWIRYVGTDGSPGQLNTAAGTVGAVTADPAYMVSQLLEGEVLVQQGDALIINSAYIGNAAIGSAQIKNAAINDAHIDVLNADKITTGTLEGITVKTTDPVTGRYSLLEGGDLSFYKAGVQTKYLKEIHAGSANSNTPVTIALDRAPQVQVSIRDLRAYDVAYANQNQRWVCRLFNDLVQDNGNGTYTFTPVCQLTLDAGAATEQLSYTYSGSTNTYTSATKTTPTNTTKITVTGNVNSNRGTGTSGSWYRRRAEVRLYYRVSPSGTWDYATTTVDHGPDFVADNFSIASPDLATNTYDYYIYVIYSDTGATFDDGGLVYDYATDNRSVAGPVSSVVADTNSTSSSRTGSDPKTITLPAFTPESGWEIYSVDYTFERAQYAYARNTGSGYGYATSTVDGVALTAYTPVNTGTVEYGNADSYTTINKTLGTWTPTFNLSAYFNSTTGFTDLRATSRIRNLSAVIKTRKAQTNSTTPSNTAFVDSGSFTLSQAAIIDGTGVVNWIAIA